jgi:hypothetical protein
MAAVKPIINYLGLLQPLKAGDALLVGDASVETGAGAPTRSDRPLGSLYIQTDGDGATWRQTRASGLPTKAAICFAIDVAIGTAYATEFAALQAGVNAVLDTLSAAIIGGAVYDLCAIGWGAASHATTSLTKRAASAADVTALKAFVSGLTLISDRGDPRDGAAVVSTFYGATDASFSERPCFWISDGDNGNPAVPANVTAAAATLAAMDCVRVYSIWSTEIPTYPSGLTSLEAFDNTPADGVPGPMTDAASIEDPITAALESNAYGWRKLSIVSDIQAAGVSQAGVKALNFSSKFSLTVSPCGIAALDVASAPKWTTARTLTLGTDLSGNVSFDGSAAFTLNATIANSAVTTGKINNSAVTLAKIANAAANTRFLGSGSAGAGAAYAEQTISAGAGIAIAAAAGGITISATGASIPTTGLITPQGRLTPVTGVPVLTGDSTAQSHVYYTPYVGPTVPIYSGSTWSLFTMSADLDMALDTSNQLANTLYDIFIWSNAGVLAIGAGPAWATSATITVTIATPAVVSWTAHGLNEGDPVVFTTTGALPTGITAGTTYFVGRSPGANSFNIATSVANAAAGTFVATSGSQSGTHTATNGTRTRGAGAGTTELQMLNGIWTNKNSITLKNGAGAGTSGIAANTATYVGTILCTANGQTGMAFNPSPASGGSNNTLGVWNAYNRVRISTSCLDSGADYNPVAAAARFNTSSASKITWVDGLAQSSVYAGMSYAARSAAANPFILIYLNLDNSTAAQGVNNAVTTSTVNTQIAVNQTFPPALGLHYLQAMTNSSSTTCTMRPSEGASTATIDM